MDYNKLYAVEAQLLDKFFANKIPKSLPYSVKRIKDTRLVQVNPKYVVALSMCLSAYRLLI